MKIIALSTLFLLIIISASAQTENEIESPATNFNSFQTFSRRNADSAMIFLRRLVIASPEMGEDLFHNTFAQNFIKQDRHTDDNDPQLLAYLKETNISLDAFHRQLKKDSIINIQIFNLMLVDTMSYIKRNIYPIAK